ncbi:MAG: QueT transporter family protein [Peptoniphilaceae bacterium]|nr:QueT transporter family protein [Peptoniphilaceae bacterium]MDD7383692.1 QueT transporter family protein [Peptoniphilaceae bacterium]MDY3738789.1 QueT transporter family protein [Peptoniphilaceae bacterium]
MNNLRFEDFKNPNFIVKSGLIAAIYAILTVSFPAFSYGPIQFRVSEILVLLVFYNDRFIPGLLLGCAIANFASPIAIFDVPFGTLASFLAFIGIRKSKSLFVASIFPTLSMIIPAIGSYLLLENTSSFLLMLFYFALSEFFVVSVLGVIIFKIIEKNDALVKYIFNF